MCGIAGILTRGAAMRPDLGRRVEGMIAPLTHRGPDDQGVWLDADAGVALGFRRLAILDLSPAGHQPMESAGGRWVCVFNGEIYNHAELREELAARGVPFRGHSDTEVLVAAVEEWGVDAALRRFVGMFAIGLWDREERVLHLARDRMGIKPLFIHAQPGQVAFASELKAILALPGVDRTLDRDAIPSFLRSLHIPGPRSVFRCVTKLPPGHRVALGSAAGPLPEPIPFWSLEDHIREGLRHPVADPEEGLRELDALLRRAVELRMVADVPVGAFLSGGIDSSLVVALMQESSPRPVKTFTIGFDDPEHNEAPQAAAIARQLGTDHQEAILTAEDARDMVPGLADWFDEPFADPSAVPNLLVCAMARETVTVALSGLGGDEVFGGYNRYTRLEGATSLLRLPRGGRRLAGRVLEAIPAGGWDRLQAAANRLSPAQGGVRLVGEKARKLAFLLREESPEGVYRSLTSAWQDPAPFVPGAVEAAPPGNGEGGVGLVRMVDRAMYADQRGYLVDDQLVIADRASMAVSLEVRVPLLDHRVVEYSWRLDPSLKIRGGSGKWCLRELLARRVPRPLFERPKVGFSVPLEGWLKGPLRDWAGDLLAPDRVRREGVLDSDAVDGAWRDFQQGSGEGALGIWTLVMFQAWMDRWGSPS